MTRSSTRLLAGLAGVLLLAACRVDGDWTGEARAEQFCTQLGAFLDDFGGDGMNAAVDELVDLAPPGPREDLETIRESARIVQAGGIPPSFDGVIAAADDLQRYSAERCP